jgi:hypothetical protein
MELQFAAVLDEMLYVVDERDMLRQLVWSVLPTFLQVDK